MRERKRNGEARAGTAARRRAAEGRLADICRATEAEALERLETRADGLTEAEGDERLAVYGENRLAVSRKQSLLENLLGRAKDPLVIQLLVICAVSGLMGDLRSALMVGGMIFLSVVLAYLQERRSGRAVEKLQTLVQTTARVKRDGRELEIPIGRVVPGDIVILAAGDIIPADIRVLSAKDFYVSQSALTGESMPVEKSPQNTGAGADGPFAFTNACFQGSNVLSGSARGVVVNTGLATFLGSISAGLAGADEDTDFDKGVRGFVGLMVRFMLVMVSLTFLIVGLTKGDWLKALMFGLAVAVGLTPEMLPMIMTVCLSKGAIAMSRKKVIVKRLKAIQNFGAMDILCTDKTGTLTQDRVVLEKYVDVTNRPSEDVLRYAYMNSRYQTGLRNLLDVAILAHGEIDVDRVCRKVDEIPFDFTRKKMSVVVDYEDTHVLICKGAVESIFDSCGRYQVDDEVYPLIDVLKNDLLEEYESLGRQGYRVLAIAYREFPTDKEVFSAADEADLILLGYVAFFDPPKDSAARSLKALREAGVAVKILTGDNELVTRKTCQDVGLAVGRIVTSRDLEGLDDGALCELAGTADVFARLTPSDKEQIIRALKIGGHVVGFLGDGINDAPAMKAADVGISVDTAVDVARESADIILLEKSLTVLNDGIAEGRRIFCNIVKYIKMGASSNFGNMFSVVGGSALLPFLPMAPLQVLVNNFLYDLSQTAIPSDRVDDEQLRRPRRWNIGLIRKFMICIGPMSSVFDYATFALMLFFFHCRDFSLTSTSPAMKIYYESLFHTGWFVESLLTQTLIVHIIRTDKIPLIQSRASTPMTLTTLSVMALAAFLPYSPLASAFGFVPLPAVYWAWIAGFLVAYSILTNAMKTWFYKKYGAV
ncbi:MAG TPA: magnesium-translocating P-type ATPase [Terriglobales bacterium]|nr:magnesium-translocating P-type ATPase [Terriglobales bacterium]